MPPCRHRHAAMTSPSHGRMTGMAPGFGVVYLIVFGSFHVQVGVAASSKVNPSSWRATAVVDPTNPSGSKGSME